MKSSSYMTRAMRAKDPRFARILGKLGHVPDRPLEVETGELKSLRADYQALAGKKPFHGWDADELRRKIDEMTAPPPAPEPELVVEPAPVVEPVVTATDDENEGGSLF